MFGRRPLVALTPTTSWEAFEAAGIGIGSPVSEVPDRQILDADPRLWRDLSADAGDVERIVNGEREVITLAERVADVRSDGGALLLMEGVEVWVLAGRIARVTVNASGLHRKASVRDLGRPDEIHDGPGMTIHVYSSRGLIVDVRESGIHQLLVREALHRAPGIDADAALAARHDGAIPSARSNDSLTLVSIHQHRTYEGMLLGVPDVRINEMRIQDVFRAEHPPHVLVPWKPRPRPGVRRKDAHLVENLPAIQCEARFSGRVQSAEADERHLSVVWFQDRFAMPIDRDVVEHLATLDWSALGEQWVW